MTWNNVQVSSLRIAQRLVENPVKLGKTRTVDPFGGPRTPLGSTPLPPSSKVESFAPRLMENPVKLDKTLTADAFGGPRPPWGSTPHPLVPKSISNGNHDRFAIFDQTLVIDQSPTAFYGTPIRRDSIIILPQKLIDLIIVVHSSLIIVHKLDQNVINEFIDRCHQRQWMKMMNKPDRFFLMSHSFLTSDLRIILTFLWGWTHKNDPFGDAIKEIQWNSNQIWFDWNDRWFISTFD